MYEKVQQSGLTEIISLSGAVILCFNILSFLTAHRREWLQLMPARRQVCLPS